MTTRRRQEACDHAVIGFGITGQAVLRHLLARGEKVLMADTRAEPPGLAAFRAAYPDVDMVTGPLDDQLLAGCAELIVSPGVSLDEPALRAAMARGQAVCGDIELFARVARAPVVAITGTNGKSTVTTLVGEMLAASGMDVRVGGNLGTAALDLLAADEPDCYVLELSSFQLDLTRSLAPRVAAVLNVTPDHLDRHGDFARYAAAKARIFACATVAVVNADDAVVCAFPGGERRVSFSLGPSDSTRYGVDVQGDEVMLAAPDGVVVAVDALHIAGRHNLANALAALAIADAMGADRARSVAALCSFRGLPHRAAAVARIDGVSFVDDSKATNPGAAIASIEGLLETTGGVVIAGGEGKGTGFDAFGDCLARHARAVVLIGRAAADIERSVGGRVPCVHAIDMAGAVRAAASLALDGDIVLLAPACASFDMFDNYAARGRAFAGAVRDLEAE
ncbi:MAG: UDP-N-acetylmuramoyl-L-alanine--D-glutamate ligase [Gammaproteobacteria bacterium]